MNILLIHGVNTNEDTDPYSPWKTAITNGLVAAGFKGPINTSGLLYNDIFDKYSDNILVYAAAVAELLASAVWNSVTAAPGMAAAPQPSAGFLSDMRWCAGMVAQWVVEDKLRADCRDRLAGQIQAFQPDVICAHSLGTLLSYDLFVNDPRGKTLLPNGTLITCGTQIGNTFVKDRMWGGQVGPVSAKMWYNLYNPNDPVFVAPVNVIADNFHQFTTVFGGSFFDESGHHVTADENHPGYLDNPVTDANIWPALAGGGMARLIARNIQIVKRVPTLPPVALPRLALLRTRKKHTFRYHPPRADHPLLKTAPRAARLAALPPSADLRNLCLPIRDQGSEGACSGFSASAFREVSHAAATGSLLTDYLAPAYLYGRTRIYDGTFPADSGASITDEFYVLQNYGVCPEAMLPYQANPNETPTPADDLAAAPFRLAQPVQVTIDPQDLKSVLASKQAICIGFTVYASFENTGADGVVPMPNTATEPIEGGHGVLVVGYDDANKWWIVRNQWGADWGANGYCFMPYGYEALWTEAWTGAATA